MTPTEEAKRSDALYTDTTSTHRRNLCDMIAYRESRIEQLEDLYRDMLQTLNLAMNGVRVTQQTYLSYYNRGFKRLGIEVRK